MNAVPPPLWMDTATLAYNLCVSTRTIDNWVAQGVIPPPRKRGGKMLWKWSEVDDRLTMGEVGGSPDSQAERIKNGTRQALTRTSGY